MQLDVLLNEGQKAPHCYRIPLQRVLWSLMGPATAVQTLRAFSKSQYHYITILDTNQIGERKFKHLSSMEGYKYGKASLTDCRIELVDSKEPDYIYETRAVHVHWIMEKNAVWLPA